MVGCVKCTQQFGLASKRGTFDPLKSEIKSKKIISLSETVEMNGRR